MRRVPEESCETDKHVGVVHHRRAEQDNLSASFSEKKVLKMKNEIRFDWLSVEQVCHATPRTRARTARAAILVLVLHQMRVPLVDLLRLAPHGVRLLGAIHVHGLRSATRGGREEYTQ